jgi:tRNA1(Val) A37 N6-methylase TrmN6
MMSTDYIKGTSLKLIQSDRIYKMTSDTYHLANFIRVRKHDRVLEVGCNHGVIIMVASLKTDQECLGIDINQNALELAKQNVYVNEIKNVRFECMDFRQFKQNNFDLVVCNPPYYKHQNKDDDHAKLDVSLSLEDLAKQAFTVLKDKGRCSIILAAERMGEAIQIFANQRFALKRIQMIHHSLHHPASSVCMEFNKLGSVHCKVEAPILNVEV